MAVTTCIKCSGHSFALFTPIGECTRAEPLTERPAPDLYHFHFAGLRFEAVHSSLPVTACWFGKSQIGGGKGQSGIGWPLTMPSGLVPCWGGAASRDLAVRSPSR